jgi:parallel beta-helix repeat protein
MLRALIVLAGSLVVACSNSGEENPEGTGGGGPTGGTSSGTRNGGASGAAGNGGAAGGATNGGRAGASAAGSGGVSATGGNASGAGGDAGAGGAPPGVCEALAPVAIGNPDHVVGDGTSESCNEDALRSAADAGGTIVFDCGSEPVTISVTSTIVFRDESVLDGGGLVTLSGGGSARILYLDSAYDLTTPRLTVQRLTFRDGNSPDDGDDTAVGGGAIYRDGGSLTVIDCDFSDNHAPATGQDVAGGAIYGFGGGETLISGSTFVGNSASDGGAVGSLNGDLTIVNSSFIENAATGTDGNPGNGGCGGALYMDGGDETTTLCGVVISDNSAGAIAGGVFRVSNSDDGTFTMERSVVSGNRVTPEDDGNAGGLYLQGLALTISASTISNNEAYYGGGIWISEREANLTNVTIAENTAFGSNGGGMWLANEPTGTIQNCTIANNRSTAEGMIAGAIFGGGLVLENTIVSGNTAMYTPGCNETHESEGGNLQFPGGALCTQSPTIEDPELGALGDNGGPTQTLVPSSSSPAIGLGTDCPPLDQRGEPRAEPCTLGAVEVD